VQTGREWGGWMVVDMGGTGSANQRPTPRNRGQYVKNCCTASLGRQFIQNSRSAKTTGRARRTFRPGVEVDLPPPDSSVSISYLGHSLVVKRHQSKKIRKYETQLDAQEQFAGNPGTDPVPQPADLGCARLRSCPGHGALHQRQS